MSKFLITSDIHIHSHKNSLQRLQHCLDALDWVFSTAIKHDIKNILFLGDLFQDRQKIQILPYHKTYECFQKYASKGLNIYMLVGNHDMWFADKCDITSVFPFNAIKNVLVIDKPQTLNIDGTLFDFLPYTQNPLESIAIFKNPSNILLGHIAINGAILNSHYKRIAEISVEFEGDMTPVGVDSFSKWKKVFLGHYHGEQRINNIEYVGSPLQLNFAEAFQEKHLIILDGESLEIEYIINNFSPKHYIINEEDIDKYDLKNSFIRIEPKDIGSSSLIDLQKELLQSKSALSVEIGNAVSIIKEQKNVEDAKNILSQDKFHTIEKYVDLMNNNLNKDMLISIGKSLIEKSQVQ